MSLGEELEKRMIRDKLIPNPEEEEAKHKQLLDEKQKQIDKANEQFDKENPNWRKLPTTFYNEEDKLREQKESNKLELAMKVNSRTGFLASAKVFIEEQPIYYDENRIWWLWEQKEHKWKITDETTIINLITEINKLMGDSGVKFKNLLMEAIKQEARKNKPTTPPKNIIQFKDKFYNLNTKEITQATPKYFCVNPIPWTIGETSDTPTMDKLFTEWVGEEWVKSLYELLAYCCYTDYPIQLIFCLSGGGRNGKSQYQKIGVKFLGMNNICSSELDAITNPNRSFEKFSLYRKLVCLMGETSYESLKDTSLLKKLTGGDVINFQKKYADPFDDYNYAKIIINTNGLPDSQDKSDGYYRRWMIIDFPNQFKEGKDIINTIPEIEYNNLANKILTILPELLERGEFNNQGTLEQRKERYEQRANPILEFIKQYCIIQDGYTVKYSTMFTKYNHWLSNQKRRAVSHKEFSQILTRNGYEIDKTSIKNDAGIFENGRFIFGLKVKEELLDFEVKDALCPIVTVVPHITTFPYSPNIRSNQSHNGHIRHTDRLNDVTLTSSGTQYTENNTNIYSKNYILELIGNQELDYEFIKKILPIPELDEWINELKSSGHLIENRSGWYKINNGV